MFEQSENFSPAFGGFEEYCSKRKGLTRRSQAAYVESFVHTLFSTIILPSRWCRARAPRLTRDGLLHCREPSRDAGREVLTERPLAAPEGLLDLGLGERLEVAGEHFDVSAERADVGRSRGRRGERGRCRIDRVSRGLLSTVDAGAQSDVRGLERSDLVSERSDLRLEPLDLDGGACAGCCLCDDLLVLHLLGVLDREDELGRLSVDCQGKLPTRVGVDLDREAVGLQVGVVGDREREVGAGLVGQRDLGPVQLVQRLAGQVDTLRDVLLRVGHDRGRREAGDLPLGRRSGGRGRGGRSASAGGRVRHDRCRWLRERHGGDREGEQDCEGDADETVLHDTLLLLR